MWFKDSNIKLAFKNLFLPRRKNCVVLEPHMGLGDSLICLAHASIWVLDGFLCSLLKSEQRFLKALLSATFVLVICGCVGEKLFLTWDTFKLGVLGNDGLIDKVDLKPHYRYLRAEVNCIPAILVLGYENAKNLYLLAKICLRRILLFRIHVLWADQA